MGSGILSLVSFQVTQGAERVDQEVQVAQLAGDRQTLLQERPRGLSVPVL